MNRSAGTNRRSSVRLTCAGSRDTYAASNQPPRSTPAGRTLPRRRRGGSSGRPEIAHAVSIVARPRGPVVPGAAPARGSVRRSDTPPAASRAVPADGTSPAPPPSARDDLSSTVGSPLSPTTLPTTLPPLRERPSLLRACSRRLTAPDRDAPRPGPSEAPRRPRSPSSASGGLDGLCGPYHLLGNGFLGPTLSPPVVGLAVGPHVVVRRLERIGELVPPFLDIGGRPVLGAVVHAEPDAHRVAVAGPQPLGQEVEIGRHAALHPVVGVLEVPLGTERVHLATVDQRHAGIVER